MARVSNRKWNELAMQESVLIDTVIHLGDTQTSTARSSATEIKYLSYDALHEATQGWSCVFGKELREAVYEQRFDVARQMLSTKEGIAKERAEIVINILELIAKGGVK